LQAMGRAGGVPPGKAMIRPLRRQILWVVSPSLAVAALGTVGAAATRQVDVPLRIDHAFIRQALVDQIYTGADGRAILWDDGTGCGFLRLWEPGVTSAGARLRLISRGEASLGTSLGEVCIAPMKWDGFLEVFEEPQLSADGTSIRFRVVDSNIYDNDWKKPFVTGRLWDVVKERVQARFQDVHIDVSTPLRDLREVLPLMLGRPADEALDRLLASLRLTGVETTGTGMTATVAVDVSTTPVTEAPAPEPALSPEELAAWEEAWQRWDAFITFVVKQLGRDTGQPELQRALGDVLLSARYDILEALAPTVPGARDPTPALFVSTWERLAPVVRTSADTQPSAVALRYLSFIAAGDALAALDQIGPSVGLEISADGLRRLARIVTPLSAEDPLEYSTAVDPELRQLLGFGPPLPPPDLPTGDDSARYHWWPTLLAARVAIAADAAASPQVLDPWLARRDNIDRYLAAVRQVLEEATGHALGRSALAAPHQTLFRRMVLATAWMESCWRQFVSDGSRVTYLRSPVNSVGMMQVNEKVWRGIYDLQGLRWDIHYNGRAGSEILAHYLTDYAVARKEHQQPGGLENLVRATYAVYNGGPGHLGRYRKPATSPSLKRIDALFWEKYEAVRDGREMEVSRCIVGQ
jgi:hypothetical protein